MFVLEVGSFMCGHMQHETFWTWAWAPSDRTRGDSGRLHPGDDGIFCDFLHLFFCHLLQTKKARPDSTIPSGKHFGFRVVARLSDTPAGISSRT